MASNPRIPATELTGVMGALAKTFSRRMLGKVPDSLGVLWHHQPVLKGLMGLSRKSEKWHECDENLKTFAHMAVAAQVGCSACLDYGYFAAHDKKLDVAKASEVPRWRESAVFTPLERDVMAYAEAMTDTPPTVTDELSARLLDALGAPGLLELTAYIAMSNLTARSNTALGLESEGFSNVCALPLARPTAVASPA